MKVYVIKDENSVTGYSIFVENEDGSTSTTQVEKLVDDGRTLALPDNPTGRRYFSIAKAEKADKMEIVAKGERTTTAQAPRSPKISFSETDLETLPKDMADTIRAAYDMLEAVRERSKVQAKIDKYKALIAQLEGRAE